MADLKTFLQKIQQNLNILKEKAAKQGDDVSLSLLNEISDHETAIDLTNRVLQGELSETEWKQALLAETHLLSADLLAMLEPSRPPLGIPFQAPPLPAHFVPRPEVTNSIKSRLLTDAEPTKPGILVVSAIHGLGGIGKSTLAAALAYDLDVRQHFSGGILWATLGQQPDLLSLLSGWIQELRDYEFRPTTVDAASTHLNGLLHDKTTLLVVDDVWDPTHAQPFCIGGSGCQVLITTRRADVADEVGAELHQMDVMTPEQALSLLAARLRRSLIETEQAKALRLADAVGYLPLALELAAVRVTRGSSWIILCEALEEEVARLEALDDPRRRRHGHTRLEAVFNLSLNALKADDEKAWQAFIWLGVLPEDVQISAPMASTIWEINETEAMDTLEILWNDALLLPGPSLRVKEQRWPSYRLHDLLRDITRRLLITDPPHGLGIDLRSANSILLSRYQKQTRNGLWNTLPLDGYIHTHLTWHMKQAGQIEQIHVLLQEETVRGLNGWYQACEELGQTAGFLSDINLAWKLADKQFDTRRSPLAIGHQCRYALMTTSLNSLAKNIPPVLLAALVERKLWTPAQSLAYIRQIPQEKLRARALAEVVPYLPRSMVREVLSASQEVESEFLRGRILEKSFSILPIELSRDALIAIDSIRDGLLRATLLKALAPNLPEGLIAEALAVARRSRKKSAQAVALLGLVPYLPVSMRKCVRTEALDKALAIDNVFSRTKTLAACLPYLSQQEYAQILEEIIITIKQIESEESQKEIIVALAPYLNQELYREVLTITQRIGYEQYRKEIIVSLAPYLAKDWVWRAMKIARKLPIRDSLNRSPRAEAMMALALSPSAPEWERVLPDILSIVRTSSIQDWLNGSPRAEALTQLAIYLPQPKHKQILGEVLETARAIRDITRRANILAKLLLYLSDFERETVLTEALEAARSIGDKYTRAEMLTDLTSYLPDSLQREVLLEAFLAAQELGDERWCAEASLGLVPYLSIELIQEILAGFSILSNEDSQARILTTLFPAMFTDTNSHEVKPKLKNAICTMLELEWRWMLSQILLAVTPRLAEFGYRRQALVSARVIRDDVIRTTALSKLASKLVMLGFPKEAWKAARAIRNEDLRAIALAELVPYLPMDTLREILAMFRSIEDPYNRAVGLATTLPRLTGPQKTQTTREALAAVRMTQNTSKRADALSRLLPHLPKLLFHEALTIARTILRGDDRVTALIGIIPYVTEPLKSQVVEEAEAAVRVIRKDPDRIVTMTRLAPYLSQTSLQETLLAVQTIENKPMRIMALTRLVPWLPISVREATWLETLSLAMEIENEIERVEILVELLNKLPEQLNGRVLQMALTTTYRIKGEEPQAAALSRLVPHLAQLPTDTLYVYWCEILQTLARHSRSRLLANIRELAPVIALLGGQEAIEEIFHAIQDVGRWWP